MSTSEPAMLPARSDEPVTCDPYALPPEAIQEPPSRLGPAIRQIGPGLILAGAIVGTGELIATTHLGAQVGFTLLWLVIASCFVKVFVQAELGRYAISGGKTTLAAFRQVPHVGLVIGWWWLIMMLTTHVQLAAVVGGVGQALHMAMPSVSPILANTVFSTSDWLRSAIHTQPGLPWAVVAALLTSLLLANGGYSIVEKGTTLLVAIFTLMTVACVVLLPAAGHPIDWSGIGRGLGFGLPRSRDELAAAFAVLGITGVGATELVAYPYWCIEKGYARKTGLRDNSPGWLARARGWVRVMLLDAWLSMIVYTVATLAFYFLGASVLHQLGGRGLPRTIDAMLSRLSDMYAPVMGQKWATVFIVAGVFAVLYSTLYAANAGHARTVADFAQTHGGFRFKDVAHRQRWVAALCIAFPIFDLALFLLVRDPVRMVLIGGIVQALSLPMIAAAAVYLRYRRTARDLAPGRFWDLFLWLSLLALSAAAAYGLWDSCRKLL